ncbi:4-hydroxy-2-oxovalerate aldolase [Candidatus Parcubacteria bacterium]|nr:4-hydroxy-2-oxovalerate aldolase [Candidatus Parcubacteria bacterium]
MNLKNRKINILECTLRDGSYAIDFQFSGQNTKDIARALEDVGFEYIEVGHGVGLGAAETGRGQAKETDEQYLKSASEVLTKAKFGMFFIPWMAQKKHLDLAKKYKMSFVRIGTHPGEIEGAKEAVLYAKDLGFEVHLNFMKTYSLPAEEFVKKALIADSWGVDVLTIVDSAGCMLPEQVKDYVKALKDKAKAKIGFHGHNNLQLVIANVLAAIEAGCDFVDTSLRGMGLSAGNAQTEILLCLLEKFGYKTGINLYKVMDIAEKMLVPLMQKEQGVSDLEVISGFAGFHSAFLPLFEKIAQEQAVDVRRLIVEVSKEELVRPSKELIESKAKILKTYTL